MFILEKTAPDSVSETQALVAEAANGSVRAFEQLYQEYSGRIFALCLRLSGDNDMALDLTQETFVKAWKNLSGFAGESTFATWLHRIGINTALAGIRKRTRRENRLTIYADNTPVHQEHSVLDQRLDLETAIQSLPDRARHVFVLFHIEGYSHSEIGDMLDIRIGTSKAHLHNARKLIRRKLKQ